MNRMSPRTATTSIGSARVRVIGARCATIAALGLALLVLTVSSPAAADVEFLPELPPEPVRESLRALELDDQVLLEAINGSTSAQPLLMLIAATLDEREPMWWRSRVQRLLAIAPEADARGQVILIEPRGTHGAYVDLIEGELDLGIIAREPSAGELTLADEQGVTLDVQPVAMDAFVFIVNEANPVRDLTLEEIRGIYTVPEATSQQAGSDAKRSRRGRITNWKALQGEDRPVSPVTRDINSGSQQLMLKLVMHDRPIVAGAPQFLPVMTGPIDAVTRQPEAIGYSVHYYRRYMTVPPSSRLSFGDGETDDDPEFALPEMIAVNGVAPTAETIADGTYPLREPVYVVIRHDTPADHWARHLRDWLLSDEGQQLVAASGYVPVDEAAPLEARPEQTPRP